MNPAIHAFAPRTADGLFVEAQRLDHAHVLRRMGLHGHQFFELLLIDQGSGIHRQGDQNHPAEPGDLFIIPPGDLHDCSQLGSAEGWALLFTSQAIEGDSTSSAFTHSWLPRHPLFSPFLSLSRARNGPVRLDPAALALWRSHLSAIAEETAAQVAGYIYGVHAHLSLLLLDLTRRVAPAEPRDVSEEDPVLTKTFDFIEKHYWRPITLEDLARAVGRSGPHLTTVLRRRTGLTALGWITERRLSAARQLLIESDLPISAIAERVGYGEQEALIRAFRRTHGATPAAWRRAHRRDPAFRATPKSEPVQP